MKRDTVNKLQKLYQDGSTLSETVLETTRELLEVSHAASTGGLASNGLLAPVVYGMINIQMRYMR